MKQIAILVALILALFCPVNAVSDSETIVGFDVDDTVLFSSPTFDAAKAQKELSFWEYINSHDAEHSAPLVNTINLIKDHLAKGDTVYFITARTGTENSTLGEYLHSLTGISPDRTYFAKPKTDLINELGITKFYGDSDTDITDCQAAPLCSPVRVKRSPMSNYTNKDGSPRKYNPGSFGEPVLDMDPVLEGGPVSELTPVETKGWGSIELNGVYTKVRWSDGDSFKIKSGEYLESRVRLTTFNTLEDYGPVHQWGLWTKEELFNIAARSENYAASRTWKCTTSGELDRYKRILVHCPDLAEAMIFSGQAHAFSMEGPSPSNLIAAQREAQKAKRGIWAKGTPKYIVTSLHSGGSYNRWISTANGSSHKQYHTNTYSVCEEVCPKEAESCMVHVPYENRYNNKADCLN